MGTAIEQHTTDDTAADNKHPEPATPVRCKQCNRCFATVAADGGLNPPTRHEQACTSCESFLGLYETLRAREQEHTALLDRGPKHHGRILAHDQYRKARVSLENFLMSIEAPNNTTFDVAQADFANRADPVQHERTNEIEEGPEYGDDQHNLNGMSPLANDVLPTEASPMIKRKLARSSGAVNLKRKRIKFSETVEERPEYRGTLEFYRGAKEYVPGRYVATEGSEYLDTSGSTKSFAKFTGQKKVGSMFVDIVPKEESQEGENQTSAIKKRARGSGKRSHGLTERPDTLEKDESQMNSRELRLSRRARSTTSPATTRPRRTIAQYDGQEDEPLEESNDTSSLVVAPELPLLAKISALINGSKPSTTSEHIGGGQRLSYRAAGDEAALEATEHAFVNQVVSNIQRELRFLQQTTVSPRYVDVVSKAVRGCFEILEPLGKLDRLQPRQIDEAEELREEEDSIYFEALDGIGESASTDVPRLDDISNAVEVMPKWSHATVHYEALCELDVSLALDANLLDDMPKEDRLNASGISETEKAKDVQGASGDLLVPSIEVAAEGTCAQARKKEKVSRAYSSVRRSSDATRHMSTQSREMEQSGIESRRRSGRTSSIAPPDYPSPRYDLEGNPTRPSTSKSRKTRVGLSRKSPAHFLGAGSDSDVSTEQNQCTNNDNSCKSNQSLTSKLDNRKKQSESLCFGDDAVSTETCKPSYRKTGFRMTGIDTTSHNNHTTYQDPVNPPEPTLEALSGQSRNEAAEGMHQGFGELINGRGERQRTQCQSESEADRGAPHFINNRNLGIAPVGEAGKESEVLIADTDREKEAQVDPDTAHDSAQVKT